MSTNIIGHKIGNVKPNGITFWLGIMSTDSKNIEIESGKVVITNLTNNQKLPILSFKSKKIGGTKKPYTGDLRVSASNLSPSNQYSYKISVHGGSISKSYKASGTFLTAPIVSEKKSVKFLVTSCLMAKENKESAKNKRDKEQKAWVNINKEHPDLALSLILGDTIYDDSYFRRKKWNYTKAQFKVRYNGKKGYQEHLAKTPVYAIYDDHDFVDNDKLGAGNVAITPKKEPRRERAARYFRQLWIIPEIDEINSKKSGCFQKIQYGMVDIFILDTRYYREPLGRGNINYGVNGKSPIEVLDNRKSLSLLGSNGHVLKKVKKGKYKNSEVKIGNEQWLWLNREFEKYKTMPEGLDRVKIIAYSSPIAKGEAPIGKYSEELNTLKDLLKPHKNVLLLAGSTHSLKHVNHRNLLRQGEDVYEVISSGIGKKAGNPAGGYAIVEVFPDGRDEISVIYYKPDGTIFKEPSPIQIK